jgi:hypothetical protein
VKRGHLAAYLLGASAAIVALAAAAVASTPSSQPSPSPSASEVASSYKTAVSTTPVGYPDRNVTLDPLPAGYDSASLITVDTAYQITKDQSYLPRGADISGPAVAALYLYSNSAAGDIQPDQTVKLQYQSTPAWVFTYPLARFLDFAMGPASASRANAPATTHSGCSWVTIVDAAKSEQIQAFQACTS